ncbi:MAG TPA: peptidylprolyl isomerase [Usitatibacter sp.]|jgi:parvulin-like peptidyl-prolyl isomerase|nr:peptidylprolyl isomerase [Usitatibacter sp.]
MSIRHSLAAFLLLAIPAYADAPKIVEDAPIIQDKAVKVDEGDVLGFLFRVPEDKRATFRTSYDRVASVADGLFIARALADRAKAEGLDKDALVQRRVRQAEEAVLADVYMEKVRDKLKDVKLEARAKELYQADPEAYRAPETFEIQHILVDLRGRTREQARERAQDLYKRITTGGEAFPLVAGRYSDDPMKTRNGGTYDPAPIEAFDPRWRAVIEKLEKGQVSEPVETDDGFHIFRLVERKPPEVPKFEAVKEKIMATELERLQKQRTEEVVQEIRSSPTVITNRDNVEALVIPVDEQKLLKLQEEAAKRLEQPKK